MMASYRNPNKKQELSAYHPNAIRNRLPVVFKDAAVPGKRFCKPRNEHTYECYVAEVHESCCDEEGFNCPENRDIPRTCPVGW